ncbi:FHA domain-containing protein [Paenibacillus sp. 1P03SA]|uniref:FHA domain-containing protein n=1 Tax=Paenibacillus sp. 1P03SA TaxID=3132294 RepID=UPI0039A11791
MTEPLQFHSQNNKAVDDHLPRENDHVLQERTRSAHGIAHESHIERKPPRGAAKKFIQKRQQLTTGGSHPPVTIASPAAASPGFAQPVSPGHAVSTRDFAGSSGGAASVAFAKSSPAAAGAAVTCFSAGGAAVTPSMREAIQPHAAPSRKAVTRTAPPPAAAAATAAAPIVPPPAGAAASAGPLRGSRAKILALGGAFLIIGMIWNAYFSAPGTPLLYISSGVTLLALDAAYILLAVGLPGRRNSQSKEAASSGSSPYPPVAEQEPVSLEQYYARLGERTTLLAPPLSAPATADETVFLGAETAPPSANFRHPVLEVMREGRKETILLDTDSFIIGRGEGDADYIEDVLGISRIHAQFIRTTEGYAVKDLGSRNGTFLNEGMLVPYQLVPLKDGDVVRMVYTEFSFRSCR